MKKVRKILYLCLHTHIYFSTYFISVTLGCRLPRRPLVAELSGWWIINCLSSARFGERTSQGISVDFGQSPALSTAKRGAGVVGRERWVSKMEEAHSSGNSRLRSGHRYLTAMPLTLDQRRALQAILPPLHFLAWEAFWNPRSWFCPWQAMSFQKTEQPSTNEWRREIVLFPGTHIPGGFSSRSTWLLASTFFLGFLPFLAYSSAHQSVLPETIS